MARDAIPVPVKKANIEEGYEKPPAYYAPHAPPSMDRVMELVDNVINVDDRDDDQDLGNGKSVKFIMKLNLQESMDQKRKILKRMSTFRKLYVLCLCVSIIVTMLGFAFGIYSSVNKDILGLSRRKLDLLFNQVKDGLVMSTLIACVTLNKLQKVIIDYYVLLYYTTYIFLYIFLSFCIYN